MATRLPLFSPSIAINFARMRSFARSSYEKANDGLCDGVQRPLHTVITHYKGLETVLIGYWLFID
jgi:hypothetical protein